MGKIVKDDLFLQSEKTFTFEKVCKDLLQRESPLIDAASIGKLDCMGKTVEVIDFCKKEFPEEPGLARGLVDLESKKVKCQIASRVIMSYQCAGGDGLCADKDIGCYLLKERFAANLKISHASILQGKDSSKLNCYFSSSKGDEVLKPRF